MEQQNKIKGRVHSSLVPEARLAESSFSEVQSVICKPIVNFSGTWGLPDVKLVECLL